jgi:hypothetical protein
MFPPNPTGLWSLDTSKDMGHRLELGKLKKTRLDPFKKFVDIFSRFIVLSFKILRRAIYY